MEKNLKKKQKKKKLKKLLFRGNNEKFIRRKEQTVTHANRQQYLLTPATDHEGVENLKLLPVSVKWLSM